MKASKKMTKLINMAMGILKPFNIPPSYDEETATLTAAVKWKTGTGHKCSRSISITEKDNNIFKVSCRGDESKNISTPKQALEWLREKLAPYTREIKASY